MSEPGRLDHSEDESFVAYLDGELDGEQRARVDALVAAEPAAAARLALLSRGTLPFREAYAPLLAAAPNERLQAMLAGLPSQAPAARAAPAALWNRRAAVAAGLALLVVGGAIGRLLPRSAEPQGMADESAEWRQLMAAHLRLYTPDTLAHLDPDDAVQNRELGSAGAKIGMDLERAMVMLPGIPMKRAQVLSYDDRPLVQVTYLDPAHGPLALCITRALDGAATMRTEQRLGMNIAYWSTKNFAFLVVGRAPVDEVERLGRSISPRVRNATQKEGKLLP